MLMYGNIVNIDGVGQRPEKNVSGSAIIYVRDQRSSTVRGEFLQEKPLAPRVRVRMPFDRHDFLYVSARHWPKRHVVSVDKKATRWPLFPWLL
jgi:hypothetical protein